ncbi:helix-turn-helix domain-containing protein [Nocardia sp. GCM10030253]|uniref:helix-turn-helix domain-containing protein n=1 Tax=Nocardia sp. GCM10030253 TaxID=3273404 RepID=UPI003643CBC1
MIVTNWTGVEVKALRCAALRLTQEQFSERIGYEPVTVRKWERAPQSRPVRGKSAHDLDTKLARLDDEQAERFWAAVAEARTSNSGHPGGCAADATTGRQGEGLGIYAWEVDGDVRRREFARLAAVAGAAAFVDPWEIGGDRLGMSDVRGLLKSVDTLELQDQRAGGAPLVRIAVEGLARAKGRLEKCAFDIATGDAFTSAAGELAVLAGWLAFDADMHPLARRCYSDAIALASQADDDDLTAHTCLYAANQSIALSQTGQASPHHALKLIDRARDLMRGRPPGRIHALIAIRQAQAVGLLGDRTAFGRAIATAWREVDQAVEYEPVEECPTWLRFVNHTEVRGHEARGYGRVGDFAKAVELFEAAANSDAAARNAVNARAWLASARAAVGDLGAALAEAFPVLEHLDNSVSSPRTVKVLEPVRRATASLPAGAEFRQRFDALTQRAITE